LAGDLCINSLTIVSWNAAEKYLRRERAPKKNVLRTGIDEKNLGGQPIKPARGTYVNIGVRYYGRTKKRDRQKLISVSRAYC